jgi:hypothetical protein
MNSFPDFDAMEPTPDEILAETLSDGDPIGVTFASGTHESDLFSFVERARRLAGDLG